MDEQEPTRFERLEKDTHHQFLMKSTEALAKVTGVLMIVALALLYANIDRYGYPVLSVALGFLLATLLFAIAEERVRRRIQQKVNRQSEP